MNGKCDARGCESKALWHATLTGKNKSGVYVDAALNLSCCNDHVRLKPMTLAVLSELTDLVDDVKAVGIKRPRTDWIPIVGAK